MFFNDILYREDLPLYEVKELSLEEALLVIAAEKERNIVNTSPRRVCIEYEQVSSVAA